MNQTQRTELLTLLARESYFERSATLTLASGRLSTTTSIASARSTFRAAHISPVN